MSLIDEIDKHLEKYLVPYNSTEKNANALLKRARDELAKRDCVWTESDNFDDTYWKTSCGESFSFIADSPKENSYHYCPSCGGRLVILGEASPSCQNTQPSASTAQSESAPGFEL